MVATLGDILLVFLADRPATAHELRQRHAQTFGRQRAVDVARIGSALHRLERLGHVRTLTTNAVTVRRVCTATEAGRKRQRSWIRDVPADMTGPDAVDRILLATAATDRETFEAVVAACVAVLQKRQPRDGTAEAPPILSAQYALEEWEDVIDTSVVAWARHLVERRRDRDAA